MRLKSATLYAAVGIAAYHVFEVWIAGMMAAWLTAFAADALGAEV